MFIHTKPKVFVEMLAFYFLKNKGLKEYCHFNHLPFYKIIIAKQLSALRKFQKKPAM